MFKATLEIKVETSGNKDRENPEEWWTVQLISKTNGYITNIVEQYWRKRDYADWAAANEMIDNFSSNCDLVYPELPEPCLAAQLDAEVDAMIARDTGADITDGLTDEEK